MPGRPSEERRIPVAARYFLPYSTSGCYRIASSIVPSSVAGQSVYTRLLMNYDAAAADRLVLRVRHKISSYLERMACACNQQRPTRFAISKQDVKMSYQPTKHGLMHYVWWRLMKHKFANMHFIKLDSSRRNLLSDGTEWMRYGMNIYGLSDKY